MTYDARQIANWFVTRAQRDGKVLSIMSLLKLTYIAHGWHLEMRNAPLFKNTIEAWQYGPVIPDVYNDFRKNGVVVNSPATTVVAANLPEADVNLLEQIWNIYGSLSAFRLSDLTHQQGGPWQIARSIGGYYAEIPNELILQHYRLLRERSKKQAANA
jgi:uncharacterized phage-associated protein